MHPTDDASFVTRLDPKGMYRLTTEFPSQCRKALDVARATDFGSLSPQPDVVVLTGLGGSAAGGDFVRALFDSHGSVPFVVNRDYSLPTFVGERSLVFATSYSGNTEETLAAYADAVSRKASIVAVTSGGRLAEIARADGWPVVQIPGGQPPRTALGFMLLPVLHACVRFGLLPEPDHERLFSLLDGCVADWGLETPFDHNEAKQLAQRLHRAVGVVYGLGAWQSLVASRWKGQINENAKNMVFANAFPELCHNEILGWVGADAQGVERWVGIVLEDGRESAKMRTRADVTERLVESVASFHHARARGSDLIEKMLSLALLGDFVSLYLAALNGVDPENIDSINVLKAELSRVP